MVKKIVIVGCGQLGSRHLQAIAKINEPLEIKVVEPNPDNQRMGVERLSEVLPNKHNIKVEWFDKLDNLDGRSDLTIVATTSRGRAAIIKKLAGLGHQRFLVEKMVCQSREEYEGLLEEFEKHQIKGWVDCGRRYFPFYERIIQLMEGEKKIIFNATGGNHGLGCNAIHLLDLFWRLTGSCKNINLDGTYLTPYLLSNRRGSDLVEFAGTILAYTREGSFASVSFHSESDASVVINMTSPNYRVFVDESRDKALLSRKEKLWHWEEYEFQALYSSNLTNNIALSILNEDSCKLPSIEDSFLLHKELFNIFNQHIKRVTGKYESLCPIT